MDYVYKLVSNVKYYYDSMNPAFLSGAIDVIVVEQPDGTLLSTPFHVRFGRYGVFNADDKVIDIQINDEEIDLKMRLGEDGVAFFVEETEKGEKVPFYLATSQIPPSHLSHEMPMEEEMPSAAFVCPNGPIPSSIVNSSPPYSAPSLSPKKIASSPVMIETIATPKKAQSPPPILSSFLHHRSLPDLSDLQECVDGRLSSISPPEQRDATPLGGSSETLRAMASGTPNSARENGEAGNATVGNIADGALSDSEIDHHSHHKRATSRPGDAEWRWGEFPESSKEKEKQKQKQQRMEQGGENTTPGGKSYYGWGYGWFNWPKKAATAVEEPIEPVDDRGASDPAGIPIAGVPPIIDPIPPPPPLSIEADDKNLPSKGVKLTKREKKAKKKDEKLGLYLEDIADDPSKMAAYFGGKRSGAASVSSNVDSGNGHSSLGTSPCSPSALSLNDEPAVSLPPANVQVETPNDITPTTDGKAMHTQTSGGEEMGVPHHESATGFPRPAVEGIGAEGMTLESPQIIPEGAAGEGKKRYDSGQSSASELGIASDEEAALGSGLVSSDYKRSLRLSSANLASLGLHYGSNEARFSITTKFQGTAWCSCHIYLLKWNQKLVISDIDGTITKSDVLGHVIPAIGGTWAHAAVAELYTRIRGNGYQMVYLSSRAIGQSHYTKSYLMKIAQGSKRLPDGPVLLSPTSVLLAFRKEVIERRPEEFKIACLSDLKALFPVKRPFYAGFGNRPTDVKSYLAVDIPAERILIINPYGVVSRADLMGYISDYASMASEMVDFLFPPLPKSGESLAKPEKYSDFSYWHPTEGELLPEEIDKYTEKSKRLAALKQSSKKVKKKSAAF